jgi:putative transcriptional regulator
MEAIMEAQEPGSLKGHFLMAMPSLADPNFYQTVTCLCEYTQAGAMGIVINRVHESITGGHLFEEMNVPALPEMKSTPIHIGGPVHTNSIFILHGPPFDWEACLKISTTLAMSNTLDILEAIAMNKGPKSFIMALGCAGWGAGQLDWEIKQNAWLTHPVSEEILFHTPVESRWEAAVRKMGIDPLLLTDTAGNA